MKRFFIIMISFVILWADDFLVYGGSGIQQSPAAEWNGTYYLVAWENYYNGNIEAQRIQKATPHLVGPMITVSTSGDYLKVPDMDSDGSRWLIVYEYYDATPNYAIYSRIVNSDGTLGTESNLSGFGGNGYQKYNPGVGFNSSTSQYLAVWKENSDYDIDGRLVSSSGLPVGNVISDILSASSGEYSNPRVASNGTNYLVVADYNFGYEIHGRIVSSNGVPQGNIINIGSAGYWGQPDVASNGNNYLVVWSDGGTVIKGRIVNSDGSMGSIINISSGAVNAGKPRVDWWAQKNKYLVVWQDKRGGTYHFIYGQLVNPDGTLYGTNKKMTQGNTANQYMPITACGDTSLVAWQDLRSDANGDIWANLGEYLGEHEYPPKWEERTEFKLNFNLQKIEPNPAKEFTRIYYSIAKPCHVKIYVYDKKGAIVKKIVDEYKPQGIYREFWGICDENNNLLPDGAYFIKFEAGKYKETKKILILK
jgi:hypothetical protein